MRFRRLASGITALALVVGGAVVLAPAASAKPPVTGSIVDNGNGTATAEYANLVNYHGLLFCAEAVSVASCTFMTAQFGLVSPLGTLPPSPVSITEGMTISKPNGDLTTLPAGRYTIALVSDYGIGQLNVVIAGLQGVQIGGMSTPIPDWVQGYGRGSAADACLDGWSPSWEQWPNGGRGGYVCTRSIPSLG